MKVRPALPLLLAYIAGILLSTVGKLNCAWLFIFSALIILITAALYRKFPLILLLSAALVAGWARYAAYTSVAENDISHHTDEKIIGFQGVIISDPDLRDDRANVVVRAEKMSRYGGEEPVSGRVMVTVCSPDRRNLEYGRRVFVKSTVQSPMSAHNPGEFSWSDYLARQRIYSTSCVTNPDDIAILPGIQANLAFYGSLKLKRWIERGIGGVYKSTEAQLIKGILLGNYALLPKDLVTAFGRSGTIHLLAASGLNCLVLISVFSVPLNMGLKFGRNTKSVILLTLLITYMLIIGVKPSIFRATTMAGLALLAYPFRRSYDSINILCAAALIILAVRPADLFEVGFQLSFAAVVAIMGIMPLLSLFIARAGWIQAQDKEHSTFFERTKNWTLRTVVLGLALTIAATLGTFPITAHYFNYISLISPVANAAMAAAVEPIFALGLAAPLTQGIPILSDLISVLGSGLAKAAISVVSYFGGLSGAALPVSSPGIMLISAYYVLLWGTVSYVSSRLIRR